MRMLIGLVDIATDPPRGTAGHQRIEVSGWNALALDVSGCDFADEAIVVELAGRQNEVLAAYVAEGDVLPVAFGAVFSTEAALCAHVTAHRASLDAEMQRLAGLCEYSLHVSATEMAAVDDAPKAGTGGAGYLRARQARRDARQSRHSDRGQFLSSLLDQAASCATEVRQFARRDTTHLVDVALLLPRAGVGALLSRLRAEGERASALGLSLRMVGPCPAYSFTAREPDRE